MSKFKKKLLGFLTAWPFAYLLMFFMFIFLMIMSGPGSGGDFGALFALIIPIHFLTILIIIGLQIFYLVDVIKSERITKDQKIIWAIALFFGGFLAMPIYWYMNIWRDPPELYDQARGLHPADGFQSADKNQWETRTGEPVPPEPHSWR